MRKSWCTIGLGLGLVLCLAGCQTMFPRPVYTPPRAPAPQGPPPAPVARPTFYVTVNRLNLRACPGMDCPKIAVLDRNQEVEKVGDAEDWSQIRLKEGGTIGWVSSRYLSPTPVSATPEVAPPPTPPETETPPPLPEIPAKGKPTPPSPPAVEKAPKTVKPGESPAPAIKKKPEEAPPTKPAKPVKPPEETQPAPEKPVKPAKPAKPEKPPAPEPPVVKPEKPAKPAPPAEQPEPPEKPEPPAGPEEKPGKIRIM
jgi:hypothetical protein